MHKMKPANKKMMSSVCQHESYVVDKDRESSPLRQRYDAEISISVPGLIDHNKHKSSFIMTGEKKDFESRHANMVFSN